MTLWQYLFWLSLLINIYLLVMLFRAINFGETMRKQRDDAYAKHLDSACDRALRAMDEPLPQNWSV